VYAGSVVIMDISPKTLPNADFSIPTLSFSTILSGYPLSRFTIKNSNKKYV